MPKLTSASFVYINKLTSIPMVWHLVAGCLMEEVRMEGESNVFPALMDLAIEFAWVWPRESNVGLFAEK